MESRSTPAPAPAIPSTGYVICTTPWESNPHEPSTQECERLKTVAPAKYIPLSDCPILFFNGSMDYRDSEELWLDLCQKKKLSALKVSESGDHFFCHDSRFVYDMLVRSETAVEVLKQQIGSPHFAVFTLTETSLYNTRSMLRFSRLSCIAQDRIDTLPQLY